MNVFNIITALICFIGSMAVFTFVQRALAPKKKEQSSVSDVSDMSTSEASPFDRLENSGVFMDKVYYFLGKRLKMENKLTDMYIMLGSPSELDPLKMLKYKMKLGGIMALVGLALVQSPAMLILFVLGFILPDTMMWTGKIKKRQEDIIRSFPSFVDLAALMIESGLDYMTAFERIVKVQPEKGSLEKEIEKTLNEAQLGYSRRDALRRMAARVGLQDIRSFVGLIIQSDELGTSLVELLRNYSADMRFRRLNKAEKLAAQASTKMLIPLFIFIFPTVFILMLSPMVGDLLHGGMPF